MAGILAGTLCALAFLLLVPEAGFSYWDAGALPSLTLWAFFMGSVPGFVIGAVGGFILGAYPDRFRSVTAQYGLSALLSLVAVGLSQLLLPRTWQLPRLKIALIIGVLAVLCARLSIYLASRLARKWG